MATQDEMINVLQDLVEMRNQLAKKMELAPDKYIRRNYRTIQKRVFKSMINVSLELVESGYDKGQLSRIITKV